jgi:hypothetical protein
MRVKVKEKYGKFLGKIDPFQVRERRKYKKQGKGKNPLIISSNIVVTLGKKKLIESGFKNKEKAFNYINGAL